MEREFEARAAEIFADALELPAEARANFLAARCGTNAALRARAEALLAAQPQGEALLRSTALRTEIGDAAGAVVGRHIGLQLGPYRLTRLLATGGMGLVYLAERCDTEFEQRVAVKLLHTGMDSTDLLQRFRTERQLLARLQHPNIARLIDGGATPDGHPYLIMEYVDGVPLDRYCDERSMPVSERLRLFCTVCDAVHYAHRNLVVHRDLKPSNLLVDTSGLVKLMDFGIAKVLDPEADRSAEVTATAQRLMTPRYASPEQLRGESITTASDVYSLGVLLYELLTGSAPYRLQKVWSPEFVRVVSEEDPLAPSLTVVQAPEAASTARGTTPHKLAQALTGDLDTIVLEAMHKEPAHRYASAEELANDIRRHLSGSPVLARPDTLTYRLSKFARRNRTLVAGVVVAFAALALGLVLSVTQYRRAVLAREREVQERAEAEWLAYEGSLAAAESSIRTNRLLEARRRLDVAPPRLRGWEWRHLASRLDRSLLTLQGHGASVTGVRFTPDGTRIVSASEDRTIRVWDAGTGAERARFGPLEGVPRSLAVDARGALVAVGLDKGEVRVLDLADGDVVLSLSDPNPAVYQQPEPPFAEDAQIALLDRPSTWASVDFDSHGDRLAVGFISGVVQLWGVGVQEEIATWKATTGAYKVQVRFRPGGKHLAIGTEYDPVELWDVATGRLVRSFGAAMGKVDLCFDPSGRRLAVSLQDQSVEVWEVGSGLLVARLRGHGGSIRALALDKTGEILVSTATDLQVAATDLRTGRRRWLYPGHTANVHSLACSPDGARLATGDWDGLLKVWDFETEDVRTLVSEASFRRMWVENACLRSDGAYLVTSTIGTSTQIWDLARLLQRSAIEVRDQSGPLPAKVLCVAWLHDGQHVAAGLASGWIALQDPETATTLQAFRGHAGDVCALDAHPELPQFVTGSRDSTLRLWELGSERPLRTLRGHAGAVLAVRYAPGGQWIASGTEDGAIRIWEVRTGRERHVLRGHQGAVRSLAISPDGALIASASFDGTVRLWDVGRGSARATIFESGQPMTAVAFTHDGSRLAAGGRDGIVRLFDPTAGREVARLLGHDDRVFWLGFAPADAALLSSSLDGTIRIWDVAPGSRDVEAARR